jgi:putative phage virion morphogenesis protein
MVAKQMVNITARAPQQVEKAMRTAIPSKAAVMAKIHFRQNFRCDLLKTRAFAVLQTTDIKQNIMPIML